MDDTTPPPAPPASGDSKPSQWPKLIGIIGILFGALALLQSAMAPLMIPFTRKSMESTIGDDEAMLEKLDAYMTDLTALSTLSAIIFALLAIVLIVGGVLLIKRQRAAKHLLLAWAVIKIVAGLFINFKNYGLTKTQLEFLMPTMEGSGSEALNNITNISATVGLIGGSIWLIALPVFLLIWFSRARIRRETAQW